MKYELGDKVLCPASGGHCGPRKGEIVRLDPKSVLVMVKYYDPEEVPNLGAWVHPIKKLKQ